MIALAIDRAPIAALRKLVTVDIPGAAQLFDQARDKLEAHVRNAAPNGHFTDRGAHAWATQLGRQVDEARQAVRSLAVQVDPAIAALVPVDAALRENLEAARKELIEAARIRAGGNDGVYRRDPDAIWCHCSQAPGVIISMMLDRGGTVPRPGQSALHVLAAMDALVALHDEAHERLSLLVGTGTGRSPSAGGRRPVRAEPLPT